MPASRSARATSLIPRSCPSNPTFPNNTRSGAVPTISFLPPQYAEVKSDLALRFDLDRLMMSRMPFGHYHTHAGNQFSFSVHKLPLVHMRDRRKVFAPVTRARALVRPRRIFVLAALHKVFGSRERRDYCSVLPNRVAAGMIEMQVGVHNH